MTRIVGAAALWCLLLCWSAAANADAREDEAKALRDEIVLSAPTCARGVAGCLGEDACKQAVEAIADYQFGLNDPSTHKDAVGGWRRFVVAKASNADCMRGLLKKDLYCRAVNLVKKFDPHLNCPSSGRPTGTCWVNNEDDSFNPVPIDAPGDKWVGNDDRLDWTQGCKFVD